MSCKQNGFRKHHGTSDTIFKFIGNILDNLNNKNHILAIFIDLKKAFDTLDHGILMDKILKLKLSPNLNRWINSYLSNRSQCTYINNIRSYTKPITHGVPQGSILGPLLFNLYINDVTKIVGKNILLYADDSVIYNSSNDLASIYANLQKELDCIASWCAYHKLTINIKKTKAVLFSSNSAPEIIYNQILSLNGETIEHVSV